MEYDRLVLEGCLPDHAAEVVYNTCLNKVARKVSSPHMLKLFQTMTPLGY
jgi:hypothetical protein